MHGGDEVHGVDRQSHPRDGERVIGLWSSRQSCESSGVKVLVPSIACMPSSQARLLAPSPLRTVRNTFALHGSSTQQRPLNERGRSLIQVQLRPTRYWLTADSHGDEKSHQACGKPHQRQCAVVICFASCISSINGLECEHRRKVCSVSGDVMLSQTGDATSICAITAQHSLPFALPYPHRPRSALRLIFPLQGAIRAYSVPLE
jgi:hypothetical protein